MTQDAWFTITWEDAHGERHESIRHHSKLAGWLAVLLDTPGCDLISVTRHEPAADTSTREEAASA